MYKLMMAVGLIVRQFFLPNPFECFGPLNGLIINLIAEPVMHALAYAIVGVVYDRGSFPALGSFLYLVTYAALTGVLALMGIFSFAWWWVCAVLVMVWGFLRACLKIWRCLNGQAW